MTKMTYKETLDYLYKQHPAFENVGAGAYKPGLSTSQELASLFGNPQDKYKIIHVAGTNGKGSVSHLLATILQLNGYKTGLYTSPHIVDFAERIRVNGKHIGHKAVTAFVERYESLRYSGEPSFFELTSTMAFDYFAQEKVDWSVVEVGMGGRLDSTNIVNPALCVITNISLDHTQFLGDTLAKIAGEKAGIIKAGVPVVIGEAQDEGVRRVFEDKARQMQAPCTFAQDHKLVLGCKESWNHLELDTSDYGLITSQLCGSYQEKNANTVLTAVNELRKQGVRITHESVIEAFARVCDISGLTGRWQQLRDKPRVVCDMGHNPGGWVYLSRQLKSVPCLQLRIVLGFVKDKDVDSILAMLPQGAIYYFTQASIERAMPAATLASKAASAGLKGHCYGTVKQAYAAAVSEAAQDDFIFVGGSAYVLADLLGNNDD